jgi:tripartite motif-containing protein 71
VRRIAVGRYSPNAFSPTSSRRALLAIALILPIGFGPAVAQEGDAGSRAARSIRFGRYLGTLTNLKEPSAAAFAPDGTILVAEAAGHRVSRFSRDGQRVGSWGQHGSGAGELLRPGGLAVGPDGLVYVADTGNDRIQVFDPSGVLVRAWGRRGRGAGELCEPSAIVLDEQRVYVTDAGNERIAVFDTAGRWLGAIEPAAEGGSPRPRPAGLCGDGAGRLFVTDAANQAVGVFDLSGRRVGGWGEWGSAAGLLADPAGLAAHAGRVYIADRMNHRIQVFDPDGSALYEWGVHVIQPREGEGRLHYPNHVAVSPDGQLAVVCEAFEDRCQLFGHATPQDEERARTLRELMGATGAHFGPRASVSGHLLAIPEPETHAIQLYDTSQSTPLNITALGGFGHKPGQLIDPIDVALDAEAGLLWVLDGGNRRLAIWRLRLDPSAEIAYSLRIASFVKSYDFEVLGRRVTSPELTWPLNADAIERDAAGNVYLLDARNRCVIVFNPLMNFVCVLEAHHAEPAGPCRLTDLAVGADSRTILVVDADGRCVREYDLAGRPVRSYPSAGSGGLVEPFGAVAAADGSVFVTDRGAHCVVQFDGEGRELRRWGREGLAAGEFFRPTSIQLDARGRLLVIDHGNHRGQYFSRDGVFEHAFGARWYVLPTRSLP